MRNGVHAMALPRVTAAALVMAAGMTAVPVVATLPASALHAQTSALADGELLNRADSVRLRLTEPPVLVLTEFVDFACSDCRAFHLARADSLRVLVEEEDLVYVFRVHPIPRLLRGYQGAEAALCAGGVGGRAAFEGMRRILFDRQSDWAQAYDPEPLLQRYGRELELPPAFNDCMRRDATWPLIAADIRQGVAMGIPGTPTFVLARVGAEEAAEMFYGNQPMQRFREAIARARAAD